MKGESFRRGMIVAACLTVMLAGCDSNKGPGFSGEIQLSSQLFGVENYYLVGYSFAEREYFKYPSYGEEHLLPEILNEGYLVIDGGNQVSLPGFNAPGQGHGFALVGEFNSHAEALAFYDAYGEVEGGLTFEALSDTVKLHQVWVQVTGRGNYVKMIITAIQHMDPESGKPYNEVNLEYIYAPDGSIVFPE